MDLLGLLDGLLAAGSVVAPPSTFSALAFQLEPGLLTDVIAKNFTVDNFHPHLQPCPPTTARGRVVLEGWSSVMASGAGPGPRGTVPREQCRVKD